MYRVTEHGHPEAEPKDLVGIMINLTIDNRQVEAEEGSTVLTNCQKMGIDIPTLCYYKALKPYGGCRLCVVEVGSALNTSCTQPVEEGMIVKTDTPRVFHARQTILRFLLLSAPNAEKIRELAEQYKVVEDRFTPLEVSRPEEAAAVSSGQGGLLTGFKPEDTNCILCGLCTRMCGELMGISAIGLVNRGAKKEILTPFGEISPVCTGCGACSFICPTGKIKLDKITDKEIVPNFSEFDLAMRARPNIFTPYPQAVPNVPIIDKTNCPYFLREKCGACKMFCDAGAIDYGEKDTPLKLDVGAVIVSSGFSTFDVGKKGEYGYSRYPNVITNLQFERLLSSSGPTGGDILRPSDGKIPHRIAFIQCVGSRDIENGVEYCCSIGCMASTKEAIIAKEHHKEIEATIFFIDMRAFGKDFDRYYENAKSQYGVRYVRSQISKVYQLQKTKNLMLRYMQDDMVKEEEFDLIVLVGGFVPPDGSQELASQLGLELDQYGFLPSAEPKDIPETVVNGSSAAAQVSELLRESRWTLTVKKEYPPERDISEEDLRIGVIVCRCGRNIASVVDVPAVAEFARHLPDVAYADEFLYSCSADSLVKIKEKIKEYNLNRVVVASCTPRTHDPLFRDTIREAGLNPCLFDMASIREHCSWVHMDLPNEATEKAKQLTAMAVSKVRLLYPMKRTYSPVTKRALVIGGGISGMTAALSVARQGFGVYLIEREKELGGHLSKIYYKLDKTDPQALLKKALEEVKNNPLINVYCEAEVKELKGFVGNFKSVLNSGIELEHGAIIVATGAEEHKPTEYMYGNDPRILLQDEFEKMISEMGTVPLKLQRDSPHFCVVMIQCVESREDKRPYCSRICCSTAIKNAIRFKESNPKAGVYILYRDIRTYGLMEKYYKEAREKGIIFILYEKEDKPKVEINPVRGPASNGVKNNKIVINMIDPMMRRKITLNPDILVLNTGMDPRENEGLSKVLKIPRNEDKFFLEAHAKIRPLDFSVEGIFLCGTCHSPRHIDEAITQAKGAAMRAVTILAKDQLEGRAEIACVKERLCRGCGLCVEVCPYSAREIDEMTRIAKVLEAVCQGCGACAAVCPSGATEHLMFEKRQIMEMIEEAVQ